MKRIILITMLFLIFTSFSSLNAQWARTYGGFSTEHAYSIQQTSDGGYIVAGETHSFGAGDQDFWVLKLSSTGAIEWQRTYGGNSWDWPYSIQQTSDGGYIVAGITYSFGAGNTDIWILKLFSTGAIEWQRTYGGSEDDWAHSIQQTSDGGYIVVGFTCSFGFVWEEVWVLKLYSDGSIEWQRTYGGSYNDAAYFILQTSDGGYIVAGETQSYGAGNTDIWILKLYSDGSIEWQRTYGGSYNDAARSIQQTSDGSYIVAGYTESFGPSIDIWILKLNSNGTTIEWQHSYGGSDYEQARSIRQTIDGGYVVVGDTLSFGAGIEDIWILKLNPDGTTIEWQRTYGGSNNERAYSILQTSDEGYVVAGQTYSFGSIGDFLILRLYSDGDIDPSCGFIGTSTATIIDTSISPMDTSITPQDTDIIPEDTDCSIQETDAVANLLCEAPKYILTISTTERGTTNPAPGTYTHYNRTEVQIEAIPDDGYNFFYWSGDVPLGHENDNPITITMDSDKSIKANFQYTLTIAAGTGGTTNPSPGTHAFDTGTDATVTAVPNSGYQFSNWSGDASGTTNPITITMDSDKSIIASFSKSESEPKEKGGCFIATVAYGSLLHTHVETLRDFRDKYLMPTKLGRMLVGFYYKNSPFFSDLIAKHKVLKIMARFSLLPVVVFSYSMLHFGPIITVVLLVFIFILPIFLILFFRRRLSQLESKSP